MNRAVRSDRADGSPLLPLGMFTAGVLALCGAVVYPVFQFLSGVSLTSALAEPPAITAETGTVALCLFAFAVVTSSYGFVLLLGRL